MDFVVARFATEDFAFVDFAFGDFAVGSFGPGDLGAENFEVNSVIGGFVFGENCVLGNFAGSELGSYVIEDVVEEANCALGYFAALNFAAQNFVNGNSQGAWAFVADFELNLLRVWDRECKLVGEVACSGTKNGVRIGAYFVANFGLCFVAKVGGAYFAASSGAHFAARSCFAASSCFAARSCFAVNFAAYVEDFGAHFGTNFDAYFVRFG